MRALSFTLLLALALVACGDDAAIGATADLPPPLDPQMLTVTVRDGTQRIQWTGVDFKPRPPNATAATPEAGISPEGGDLTVSFRLETAGAVLSNGSVTVPRRRDWRWRIDVIAATTDPRLLCFGCSGSAAFPLAAGYRAPGRDSIWVVWGGNSISNPVVY